MYLEITKYIFNPGKDPPLIFIVALRKDVQFLLSNLDHQSEKALDCSV